MARQYISLDNLRFLLYEVHRTQDLLRYEKFVHLGGQEEIDLLLQSAKGLADQELFPYFKEMDSQPVVYRDGHIRSHPQLKNIFRKVADAGWFTALTDLEDGGMQLPYSVFSMAHLIFESANSSAQGYLGLTTGALELIMLFSSPELKAIYKQPIFDGRWQGTMALTEPQAGSSLSDIVTSASPAGDGAYAITGQKIFISAGEHEACENFVHLTLARIKGAPAGTKGISLFIVPKFLPGPGGTLIDNHVDCVADFQKLGQRGYATAHLVFGERGETKGFLVGEENKGLGYMFQMMNSARIAVGQTAAGVASAAYYYALQYANERPQGRHIADKDLSKGQTLIIHHADVRRMLMHQKAFVEGSLSLVVECLKWYDLERVTNGEEQMKASLLLDILTPIVKTYPSDGGIHSVSQAVQVLGGYGFTMDFDVQQYYRDIRIMAIYEGTSGIQSIDLLGRKIAMHEGRAFKLLAEEMTATLEAASAWTELGVYVEKLSVAMGSLNKVLTHLQGFAAKGEVEKYLADANLFMEMCGITCVAWQWLKQGILAQEALKDPSKAMRPALFYDSKMETLKYFYKYDLPKTAALAQSLMNPDTVTIQKEKDILI